MSKFEALTFTIDDGVAQVTLSRPEILNRFDAVLHVELTECLLSLRSRSDVRAVVLASSGKVFSAGGDIELMRAAADNIEDRLRIVDDGRRLLRTLADLPQPLVTALHADAIGLGASIVLASDAVVAARSAGLADTHVQFALVAGDGGCAIWPAAAGLLRAKRHLLTGDRIDADAALAAGLVTDLVETPEEAGPAAMALAAKMAALPPLAVQGTKRALNHLLNQRISESVELSFALELLTLGSDDLREAIASFVERRSPTFSGR
jgi:enoyl-CoA hydratase